jgi:5-(carboxyamino)imidazole ribonucleotide synthase
VDGPRIAVVGGGQLARMMQQAAIGLGVPLRLLAEAPDVSAAQVVAGAEVGAASDLAALRSVPDGCAVLTFDHEHVRQPPAPCSRRVVCRPGPAPWCTPGQA